MLHCHLFEPEGSSIATPKPFALVALLSSGLLFLCWRRVTAPLLTPLCAARTPLLASLMTTSAPLLTPLHPSSLGLST